MKTIEELEKELAQLQSDITALKNKKIEEEKELQLEKFDFAKHMKGFVDGKIAVNCRRIKDADAFLNALSSLKLDEVNSYKCVWDEHKDETCYSFYNGFGFCSIDWYKRQGLKIVQF